MWYRIKCENVKAGELAEVYSIDLGIVAFLSFRHIKKLPAELLFHPSHVFRCILGTIFFFYYYYSSKFNFLVL
jgi:hypothetical protein